MLYLIIMIFVIWICLLWIDSDKQADMATKDWAHNTRDIIKIRHEKDIFKMLKMGWGSACWPQDLTWCSGTCCYSTVSEGSWLDDVSHNLSLTFTKPASQISSGDPLPRPDRSHLCLINLPLLVYLTLFPSFFFVVLLFVGSCHAVFWCFFCFWI